MRCALPGDCWHTTSAVDMDGRKAGIDEFFVKRGIHLIQVATRCCGLCKFVFDKTASREEHYRRFRGLRARSFSHPTAKAAVDRGRMCGTLSTHVGDSRRPSDQGSAGCGCCLSEMGTHLLFFVVGDGKATVYRMASLAQVFAMSTSPGMCRPKALVSAAKLAPESDKLIEKTIEA